MRRLLKSEEMNLSLKNFKLNKKRTISTIIGIILSVALICAVATMATSFQETLIQNAISETGYYHLKIENTANKDKEEIDKNKNVKETRELYDVGYAKLDGCENIDKPYVHLYSMTKQIFKDLKAKIDETANIMKGISSAAVEQQSGVEQLIGPFQKWTVLLSLIIHW